MRDAFHTPQNLGLEQSQRLQLSSKSFVYFLEYFIWMSTAKFCTFTAEQQGTAPHLDPSLEAVLRSHGVHDEIIMNFRRNDVLSQAVFVALGLIRGGSSLYGQGCVRYQPQHRRRIHPQTGDCQGHRLMERIPDPVRDQNQSRRCGQSPRRASVLPSVRMGQDPQDFQRQVWPTDSGVLLSSSVLLRNVRRKGQRGKPSSRNTGSGNQFGRGGSSRTFQTRTPEAASSHSGGKPNTSDASSFHLTDANISEAVADKVSSSFQLVAPGQASSARPCTLQGTGRTHVANVVGRAFEKEELCLSTAAGKLRSGGWARLEPLPGVRISNSGRGLATHGRRRFCHRCSTLGYGQLSPTPHGTSDHVSHSAQCQVRKGQTDQEHSLGKQSQRAREAACQHQEQQVAIPSQTVGPHRKTLGREVEFTWWQKSRSQKKLWKRSAQRHQQEQQTSRCKFEGFEDFRNDPEEAWSHFSFHEKARSSPGICFLFQKHACFDSGKCGEEHICIGCGRAGVPYNDSFCLESSFSMSRLRCS